MLILPQMDCVVNMASTMDLKCVPKTIDSILAEQKEALTDDTIKTSPSHNMMPAREHQNMSPQQQNLPPLQHLPLSQQQQQQQHQQRRHQHHQKEFQQHQQQPRQPHHNWDINDSSLPVPERYDPFDLWPVGHCRRVYRGDIDDARRHISGWAMRNTNNHNALILKKSCLGVLICSNDCMMDNGKKVNFRPAICDKARRKQIGKPCPNPGCCGKLTLLPCRGHCGYPVTHFWRQVKGSVFFQAKGYHDHPRPDVKSLSEKGRNALAKHIRHNLAPLAQHASKRRHAPFTHDEVAMKKMSLKEKEMVCSCPPFECNCQQLQLSHKSKRGVPYPTKTPAFNAVVQPAGPYQLPQDPFQAGPVTQINITNTCLPNTNLGVNIPYTPNTFLPPNSRIYHPNAGIPEDHVNPFMRFNDSDLPSQPGIPSHPPLHHNYDEFKSRHSQIPYPEYHQRPQDPISMDHPTPFPINPNDHLGNNTTSPFERLQHVPKTPNQFTHQREAQEIHSPPSSEHDVKPEHFQPNFLIPYDVPHYDSRSPVDNRSHGHISTHQNPAFLPDFNALSFCTSPTFHPRECSDTRENSSDDPYNRSSLSRENNTHILHNEQRNRLDNEQQNHEMNVQQPTFITLTSPEEHNYEQHRSYGHTNASPQSTPCSTENMTCHSTHTPTHYNQTTRASSTTPTHSLHLASPDATLMHLENASYEAFAPMPQNMTGVNGEVNHIPEVPVANVPCSSTLTPPPSHHELSSVSGQQQQQQQQHIVPNEGSGLPHYHHGPSYTNTPPPNTGYNPYCGDLFQPTPNQHSQQFQHPQQHAHQHPHSQKRNSINITLTYA